MRGYLVVWERSHALTNWEFLAFTRNLHMALLVAKDWEDEMTLGVGDCPGCLRESKAHIFEV